MGPCARVSPVNPPFSSSTGEPNGSWFTVLQTAGLLALASNRAQTTPEESNLSSPGQGTRSRVTRPRDHSPSPLSRTLGFNKWLRACSTPFRGWVAHMVRWSMGCAHGYSNWTPFRGPRRTVRPSGTPYGRLPHQMGDCVTGFAPCSKCSRSVSLRFTRRLEISGSGSKSGSLSAPPSASFLFHGLRPRLLKLDPVPQGFIRGDRFYICVYLKRKSSLKS